MRRIGVSKRFSRKRAPAWIGFTIVPITPILCGAIAENRKWEWWSGRFGRARLISRGPMWPETNRSISPSREGGREAFWSEPDTGRAPFRKSPVPKNAPIMSLWIFPPRSNGFWTIYKKGIDVDLQGMVSGETETHEGARGDLKGESPNRGRQDRLHRRLYSYAPGDEGAASEFPEGRARMGGRREIEGDPDGSRRDR